jgi:hypothetical protein
MANARRRTQRPSRTNTRMAARNAGPSAAATTLEAEKTHAGNLVNWDNEMKYINKDLRELAIISVALFALLFVVGFFL